MAQQTTLKLYRGFGHTNDMVVFGHVLANPLKPKQATKKGAVANLIHLINLFIVKPVSKAPVHTTWQGKICTTTSEHDGFFWLEWKSPAEVEAGVYTISVTPCSNVATPPVASSEIIIPHRTQYAFISDVDDTVMMSHSAKGMKRLKELLFKSPAERSVFPGVATHYQLLAQSNTNMNEPNPFFYVSSSEWNLYDYLDQVFTIHQLPKGIFLLSQMKKWYQLFKTGKTKHEGKLMRIMRLFVLFPQQRFVLFGDNSQSDPVIYEILSQKYADRMAAVYIRNVVTANKKVTGALLKKMEERNIVTLQFTHSEEAIAHSRLVGLVTV